MSKNRSKANPYQVITDKFISLLEQDIVPWQRPWQSLGMHPRNFVKEKSYHGINVWLLLFKSKPFLNAVLGGKAEDFVEDFGDLYDSPLWAGYAQIKKKYGERARIRKGEKATQILRAYFVEEETEERLNPDTGKLEEVVVKKGGWRRKLLNVFNVEQWYYVGDNDEELPLPGTEIEIFEFDPIERAEEILANAQDRLPELEHGHERAFYRPSTDTVGLPDQERFGDNGEANPGAYYATAFHEQVHATGHEDRIDRDIMKVALFGSGDYSFEELVAELGAAYLCSEANIDERKIVENQAAYIKGWLEKLQGDRSFVIRAARKAEEAALYILQGPEDKEATEAA